MPEDDKSTPVRRGPGRPRKVQEPPKPEVKVEVPENTEVAVEVRSEPTHDPEDPRIGQSCDPDWSVVAFSDTDRMYRCENGVIVERVR